MPVPRLGAGLVPALATEDLPAAGVLGAVENTLPIQMTRQRQKSQALVVGVGRKTTTSRGNMWIAGTNCKENAVLRRKIYVP